MDFLAHIKSLKRKSETLKLALAREVTPAQGGVFVHLVVT